LEALLLTGRPFTPVFLEELLVNLGEAGTSSDAGDRFSSFMAAVGGRFPQIQDSSLDDPNFFSGWWDNDCNGFFCVCVITINFTVKQLKQFVKKYGRAG
jgi:hypothetical protein